MNKLDERKRALLAQADLHRGVLGVECARLRARLEAARATARAFAPWLAVGGAVAGVLIKRRWRGMLRLIEAGLTAWRWFRRVKAGQL